ALGIRTDILDRSHNHHAHAAPEGPQSPVARPPPAQHAMNAECAIHALNVLAEYDHGAARIMCCQHLESARADLGVTTFRRGCALPTDQPECGRRERGAI